MSSTIYSKRSRTFIGADGKKHWLNVLSHDGRDRLAKLLNELAIYLQDAGEPSFADMLGNDITLQAHVFAIMDLFKLKREWLNADLIYTFIFSDGEGNDDTNTPGLLANMHELGYEQAGKASPELQKSSYYRFIFNIFLLSGGITDAIAALQQIPYDVMDGLIVEHNSYMRDKVDNSMTPEAKTKQMVEKRKQQIMADLKAKI